MRFESIDLARYGRFSGRQLQFPQQDSDFHLVLGRNEAGKSTLRQAFRDLLFGIPMNTPMGFLHPGTDLELAARLSGEPGELHFARRRKRKGGLVGADGEPLAADALQGWLGDVTEAFYERMFGLDHHRLEAGSRAMLEAGDKVDSVLFQAAAGVTALNGVLTGLQEEAASLWAPRKSGSRAWYTAATRLGEAEAALKAATIRPAAWADAHRESRRLEEAFAQAEAEHAALLAQVRELERLRRSAPLLAQIREHEARAGGQVDPAATRLLQYHADIARLEEMRLRVADHRAGVERCGAHNDALWGRLGAVLRQLGRPVPSADPASLQLLSETLPSRPLRRQVEQCLQEGREADTQSEAARLALEARREEFEHLKRSIDALPSVAVGPALRRAVDAVTAAGDIEALSAAALRAEQREREAFGRRLGALAQPGVMPPVEVGAAVEWLESMQIWPAGSLAEHGQRRQHLQSDVETLRQRAREAERELQAARLELEQFRRSHQAISRDEVLAARRERDAAWEAMARGAASPETDGAHFATLLQHADSLADLQLQAVDDAARLQRLQHEHERLEENLKSLRAAHGAAADAVGAHEREWAQGCELRGLPVLPPGDMPAWQAGREAALAAHERLSSAGSEYAALKEREAGLLARLRAALETEGQGLDGEATLPAAREAARALLQHAEQAQARRQALEEQCARIEPQLPALEKTFELNKARHAQWRKRWHDVTAQAGMPADADAAYFETAISLLADADDLAGQLREGYARRDRLEAELDAYAQAAGKVAKQLQDDAFDPAAVDAAVHRWVAEVGQARAAETARNEAQQRLADCMAHLLREGEGRSRQQMEAELAEIDVSTLALQSEERSAALAQAASASNALAVECEQARRALEAISGGDAAALAEARRQEALADMADIGERYVQLHLQSRLLERVMERYRERRQGPLLARAGRLFSELTLGAHGGLVVDSENEAALLQARRADGSLVPLDGLSEGTRDQLYLALRLAALELYLDSAPPMPFIADDLFVNYDDRRAEAGLRQLSNVARRTQVVFLTHHAHMVELARDALGGAVHVIELDE